jgi:peptidoglycan/LPS O-acetylase OafA/YrhL
MKPAGSFSAEHRRDDGIRKNFSSCRVASSSPPVSHRIRLPFEKPHSALYNLGRNFLPEATSNPAPALKPRRWSIVAAGLLLLALALVVIYTSRSAFFSPLALVVVAAIGLAALLMQLRLRKDLSTPVHAPLWLNVLGLVFAIAAVFADVLHLSGNLLLVAALGAVVCFGISGTAVLHALRKKRA